MNKQCLTSDSTGRVCCSFFITVGAVPSYSHLTFGIGLPDMVAGILIVVPA